MARRIEHPWWGSTTDHRDEIEALHVLASRSRDADQRVCLRLAAELLEAHDDTGISLDHWATAREFVESRLGKSALLHEADRIDVLNDDS